MGRPRILINPAPFPSAVLTSRFSRPHCPSRYLGWLEGGLPGKFPRVSCEESWSFLMRGKLGGASHSQAVKIGGCSHQPLPNLTPLFWTLLSTLSPAFVWPSSGASLSSPLRANIRWATECVNHVEHVDRQWAGRREPPLS